MELKLVIKTGRSAVVEFDDGGKYYSKEEYTLLINGCLLYTYDAADD